MWLNQTESAIEQDISKGLDLGVQYLQSQDVSFQLESVDYADLAKEFANQQGDVDWVLLGPQSSQVSKLADLNRIRKRNGLDQLKAFTIWQESGTSQGLFANELLSVIESHNKKATTQSFSGLLRIWQSHKKIAKHQESIELMDFSGFVLDYCQNDKCQDILVYPEEFNQLSQVLQQSLPANFEALNKQNLNWVLINATVEHAMIFSTLSELYLVGFYHYQQNESSANDWLIEQFLKMYQTAPNQYVALGFEAVLMMNNPKIKESDSILNVVENKLVWHKHHVKFQQGWPVLRTVQMN